MEETITRTITTVEKPHSYEFGKAGNRHKVYYKEVADLIAHLEQLKACGLIEEEENEMPSM